MVGRNVGSESGKLRQDIIDKLISLWVHPDDPLTFMQIHRGLVKKGVVKDLKNKMTTVRILRRAQKLELIKHENGSKEYYLNVVPDEFKIFAFLQKLREESKGVLPFKAGGFLWDICQLYCLGMPESALKQHPDIEFAFQILGIRIARLFTAIKSLAEEAKKREKIPDVRHGIPEEAAREILLELIPYYLGSRAGCDFDGLLLEDVQKLVPIMIKSLPEEVEPQNPTLKDEILKNVEKLQEMIKRKKTEEEEELAEEEMKDFALIIIPPEHLIDEDGQERRWIKLILEENADKSPLYIAAELLGYKKENVDNVLDIYGGKLLGKAKLTETRTCYEKMHAACLVSKIIGSFNYYDDKTKKEALKVIQELTEKVGRKSIIVLLAFGRHYWAAELEPDQFEEEFLQKFFPYHTKEEIRNWLAEGAALYNKVVEEQEKEMKKKLS